MAWSIFQSLSLQITEMDGFDISNIKIEYYAY